MITIKLSYSMLLAIMDSIYCLLWASVITSSSVSSQAMPVDYTWSPSQESVPSHSTPFYVHEFFAFA